MVKRRRRKSKRSSNRRMRVIRAYLLRVLVLLVMAGLVFLVFKGVARIFHHAPGETQSLQADGGGAAAGSETAADEENPDEGFLHSLLSHAGEAKHLSGKGGDTEEEQTHPEAGALLEEISVDGSGRIKGVSETDFDESIYSAEELEESVNSSIEEYDRIAGDTVSLEKLKVSKGSARCVIKYASSEDYRGFNGVGLYVGKVDELLLKGVRYDKELESADGSTDAIPAGSTKAISDQKLITLAVDESMTVKVPGKIMYVSDDVTVTGKKTAECHNREGYSFVVYKKPFLNLF